LAEYYPFYFILDNFFLVPLTSANVGELEAYYVDRGGDGLGEGDTMYSSDCIGHGLPTLQPQTIL